MSQHFLLSKTARSLSLARVARLSDDEARKVFQNIRWASTNGEPVCPRCGCVAAGIARSFGPCQRLRHRRLQPHPWLAAIREFDAAGLERRLQFRDSGLLGD
jgi:hypothetical protein